MPLFANSQTLKGVVMEKETPLVGVAIQVMGDTGGQLTDIDGAFTLNNVKRGDKILFDYLGLKSQTIVYQGQTFIKVEMVADDQIIDEVVVVGFGQQRKESVVGAITQASSEDILRAGNVTSISEALTGLLPGVSTMQATGQPGSTDATLLIRGKATWGSDSSPLFMVDGVERDFNSLDPNEIASISVLKDASATAVYGVKAANGVILITTKMGKKAEPQINFSATWTMKSPTIDTDYISDYPTTLQYYNQASMNDDKFDQLVTDREIAIWSDPNRDMDRYTYTRFVNDLMKTGYSRAYNVNVSGGNDFVTYFTSIGYNYDGDIFDIEEQEDYDPRTYQNKYNWRSNLDFKVTKTTKLSVRLSGDVIDFNGNHLTKGGGIGDSSTNQSFNRIYEKVMIGAPAVFSNGLLGMVESENKNSSNLLADMERSGSFSKRSNKLYTDFVLEQQIFDGLKATAKLSYDQYRQYQYYTELLNLPYYHYIEDVNNPGTYIYDLVDKAIRPDRPDVKSETLNSYNKSLYYEFALNYNKTFAEKHELNLMGIMTRRTYQNALDWTQKEEAWIARATYAYDYKYLLEFNGAYTGSEKFAPGNRFGFFPSAAIGYVLSEENFFKENLSWLEFFKIRYSYGLVGSDSNSPRFAYLSSYSTDSQDSNKIYYGNTGGSSTLITNYYKEGTPANVDAGWETSIKQNLGFEFTLLDGRLGSSIDLFDEHRKDIYMQYRTIPSWYGGTVSSGNIGETKNHGIDAELTWVDKIGELKYWAKGNISLSENRIIYKNDPSETPAYQQDANKPIGWAKGLLDYGLYQSWQDLYLYPQSSYNPNNLVPGDLIFADYDGDFTITDLDQVAIGDSSYATKTYAFSGGLEYKGFSISAMFNGMFGISKYLAASDLWCYTGLSTLHFVMHNNDKLDSWTYENADASHPALHTASVSHNQETSTYTYRNSSFLRLRNLEIKYNFSNLVKSKISWINHLELSLSGQNLFTWSNLPDVYDPEAQKLNVYPISKKYSLGIRCTF
ncbi:MAG: TonB-dependent receptor [Rikenellaceae bacterium]